jgi:hypothetical protein
MTGPYLTITLRKRVSMNFISLSLAFYSYRIHLDTWPSGSSKHCLFMVLAGEVLKNTETHVSR